MTLLEAATLGGTISVALTTLALGLHAGMAEVTYLLRHPRRFGRAILAVDIVMPLFVIAVLALTSAVGADLPVAIRLALVTLAISPITPTVSEHAMEAGIGKHHAVGLLVAVALVAFSFTPVAVEVMGLVRGLDVSIHASTVLVQMAETVLGPLLLGIVLRKLAPRLAERAARPISRAGLVLLYICLLSVLPGELPEIWELMGDGALASIIAFVLVGLAVGHYLGGPGPDGRTMLAVGTASRHPGVAMAIASANFPNEHLVIAAMLMYLLASRLLSVPYLRWRMRPSTSSG
jgi:BASS family bile acid:Na+ symporter